MRYSFPLLLVCCFFLWSCGSDDFILVNETKYKITCEGWIYGADSTTTMIDLEPGQTMTVGNPPHDTVRYFICTDVGIAYFDGIQPQKTKQMTLRINGNYPQLSIDSSSGPLEITGDLDAKPGFELSWEGEPPANKQPNADGLFDYSQFQRGMSIGELDWIIAGKYEQHDGGPRQLPLLFSGLKWQGTIYEYQQIQHDNMTKGYRGEIQLEAEASAERLEKALDWIYAQGFRPVYFRLMGETTGKEVDFREADNNPDNPEEQKKALRGLLEKALDSDKAKVSCILVHEEMFEYLEGPLNQYDFLCWIIMLNMQEKSLELIDTNTIRWGDLAFF